MLISLRTNGQATCLCDKKIRLLKLGYFITYKMFHLNTTSSLATSKFYKTK